jgi:ribonuclease P protein component
VEVARYWLRAEKKAENAFLRNTFRIMHFSWQTRLARSSEIKRVFSEGKRLSCGVFLLIAAPNTSHPEQGVARACVIVSRKVSRRAVDRNRLKRQLRALYREHQSLLPADMDIILIARSGMLTAAYADLQMRFKKACANLKSL